MDKIEKIKEWVKNQKKEELARNSIGVITGHTFFVDANELLSFLDTLSEEPDKSLEEAAEDFVWEVMENDEEGISELSKKLRPTSKISDFYDALGEFFIAGAEWQKIQMLKDAVEGEICGRVYDHINVRFADGVCKYLEPKNISHIPADVSKYNIGDKVRIVVLKEEE